MHVRPLVVAGLAEGVTALLADLLLIIGTLVADNTLINACQVDGESWWESRQVNDLSRGGCHVDFVTRITKSDTHG